MPNNNVRHDSEPESSRADTAPNESASPAPPPKDMPPADEEPELLGIMELRPFPTTSSFEPLIAASASNHREDDDDIPVSNSSEPRRGFIYRRSPPVGGTDRTHCVAALERKDRVSKANTIAAGRHLCPFLNYETRAIGLMGTEYDGSMLNGVAAGCNSVEFKAEVLR
ncbi:hypothetical protein IWX46DRAFT_643686 [Phyllosticta citricarpa]|uniref:Uncharacterized protein n=1 Tax=Phyllosticta citricarpa TaxID=55181 RepID=A0ABR1LMR7_9PEZI